MKKLYFLFFALVAFSSLQAQILDPSKWTSRTEKISGNEFNLIFEGTIEDGWHIYSQWTPDGGPLPMEVTIKNAKNNFQLIGKAQESKTKRQFNPVFEVDEIYWDKKVTITQKIKVINEKLASIDAVLEFQICKESCINQDKSFTFKLPKIVLPAAADGPEVKKEEVTNEKITEVVAIDTAAVVTETAVTSTNAEGAVALQKAESKQNGPESRSKKDESKGLLMIFFLSFLGGFAALLTPCVFPMIPMTVSFFTKQSKTKAQGKRNAIIYGLSIIAIYLVLGSVVTGIFGAEALNALSTDVWFNVIFFLLLVVFAVSFLGAFEIMLPNSWANKVDKQADRGGIVGILFMALALAIVSFSCTGPIVGTLLVESASKGGIAPIIGMLGFSTALALPFMLFAMFPGWLNSMPKSGGWLNTVKVSLGFLELALAFKFLSNADLVLQLHYIEREVFLAIWIAVFGAWALYLFGKITLPHDSPLTHISVGRLCLGLVVLAFTVYMIPGLFGAPLKLISAFPPPQTYSESPNGFMGGGGSAPAESDLPEFAEYGPHGIVSFTDYEKGMAYAKKINKPVLIDFTGFACVNCRKMENNVWTDPHVLKVLKNDIVLISLYVDDKRDLPKEEQFVSPNSGKKIVTVGNKWSDFIIHRYETNTQPFYVLADVEGNNLNDPIGYTPDIEEYKKWLQEGISNFK